MSAAPHIRDVLLPVAVVAVVGMMVFPLPVAALDLLLACNIAFSLLMLLTCVYLTEPERFTSLPTLLLLSTLFRLSLNISTTRQLLAFGKAPAVVAAFGNCVVGGNLAVEAVLFLIITLVQFIVIAKGAERVAEVAARFTLDAMPGKQMAIDADLRSGMISTLEARQRRKDLQRESRLFGALDGAMKFVKGDAVAGLMITAVNIVGGLIIGITQLKLPLDEALQRYTIFTVGDGLVSQIPALLVAVSAAIAVTRVADKETSFAGRDVIKQLSQEPQALMTAGTVLAGLALVPGLPFLPFLLLSALSLGAAVQVRETRRTEDKAKAEYAFRPKALSALVLQLGTGAVVRLQKEGRLINALQQQRRNFFQRWALVLPQVHFDVVSEPETLQLLFYGAQARDLSGALSGPETTAAVVKLLDDFLDEHAAELVDDTQTRLLLEAHEADCEDLINSAIPAAVPLTALTRILRSLVEEGLDLHEFKHILQSICEAALEQPEGKLQLCGGKAAEAQLLAAVRKALRRTISNKVLGGRTSLKVRAIASHTERLLMKLGRAGLSLEPVLGNKIAGEILAFGEPSPVIICAAEGRRVLWEALHAEEVKIDVVAAEEISPECGIEIIGAIGSLPVDEERMSAAA